MTEICYVSVRSANDMPAIKWWMVLVHAAELCIRVFPIENWAQDYKAKLVLDYQDDVFVFTHKDLVDILVNVTQDIVLILMNISLEMYAEN